MSLKFPISLVGKKGGSITDGLVDWWDGGSTIGQFAGNNIGYMGPDNTEHPSTFGGSWNWNQNKKGVFAGLGCSFGGSAGKQTIGLVIRKKSYSVNSYIIQAGAGGACRLSYNNDGYRLGSSYFNYGTIQRNVGNNWHLVLYQWDGETRTGQTFFNDELVPYTSAPNQGNGSILRIGYNYGTSIEVAQIAYWNRWMTQEDADLLYNGGAFRRYVDLPDFEPAPENTYAFDASGIVHKLTTGNITNNFARYVNPVSSIQIGTNATTIGSAAFRQHDCTEINIPSNITTIGDDAFFQGSQTNVALNFSEGLRTIGGSSFESTRWAGDIFLPTTLTSVGSRAFTKSNGDSTVRNYHINSPASVFTGTQIMRYHKVTDTLYVHADYLSQYDAAWKTAQAQDGLTIAEWTSYPDPMP
jgi:hypothetical protein